MKSKSYKPVMKEHKLKHHKGVDDLLGLSAFVGSWGQGDHYSSNDVSLEHPCYVSYVFDGVPKTQECVDAEVERRKKYNEDYIARLKENGEYNEEYFITLVFVTHPLFDEPASYPPTFSSKVLMIDLSNNERKD